MYIFWFLHQTTTVRRSRIVKTCCISFDSYIKPQLPIFRDLLNVVVYLLIPTSNHNQENPMEYIQALYIFWFLHQTTIRNKLKWFGYRCISFDSYIKPQLGWLQHCSDEVVYLLIPTSNHNQGFRQDKVWKVVYLLIPTSNHNWSSHDVSVPVVVYLLIPTSNHNHPWGVVLRLRLYIFWFLHQTTTGSASRSAHACCISFDSYIKPQLFFITKYLITGCISFDSYIKPQLIS